jgi:hypothetical protein
MKNTVALREQLGEGSLRTEDVTFQLKPEE